MLAEHITFAPFGDLFNSFFLLSLFFFPLSPCDTTLLKTPLVINLEFGLLFWGSEAYFNNGKLVPFSGELDWDCGSVFCNRYGWAKRLSIFFVFWF